MHDAVPVESVLLQTLSSYPENLESALRRFNDWMQPLSNYFQENAVAHIESLLTLNPVRLHLRDWMMCLLPQSIGPSLHDPSQNSSRPSPRSCMRSWSDSPECQRLSIGVRALAGD